MTTRYSTRGWVHTFDDGTPKDYESDMKTHIAKFSHLEVKLADQIYINKLQTQRLDATEKRCAALEARLQLIEEHNK